MLPTIVRRIATIVRIIACKTNSESLSTGTGSLEILNLLGAIGVLYPSRGACRCQLHNKCVGAQSYQKVLLHSLV